MSVWTGANVTELLGLLTTKMGVDNLIGTAEDARATTAPRVTWVPPEEPRETYAQPVHQPHDGHACLTATETYEVHAWGEDFSAAQDLRNLLIPALSDVLSSVIFKLGAARYIGDGISQNGFVYIVQVSFEVPIYDRHYRKGKIAGVATGGLIVKPGDSPEVI